MADPKKWAKFGDGRKPYLPGWSSKKKAAGRRAALERMTARVGCTVVWRKLHQLANVTRIVKTAEAAKLDRNWLRKQGWCRMKTRPRA